MIAFLIALLWAPISFLLHSTLHELAHAVVAVRNGARITEIWPFPGKRLGYFTWAHVRFEGLKKETLMLSFAPIVAELVWFSVFSGAMFLVPPVLRWVVLVELISSCVDITTWVSAWWKKEPDGRTDAERSRKLLGWDLKKARLASVTVALLYVVCLVVAIAGMV